MHKVSWSNLLHTLTAGGSLCIPSDHDRLHNIPQSMNALGVNYAHFTPTVGRLLDPYTLPQLETLQFSGEPLTLADVSRWQTTPTVPTPSNSQHLQHLQILNTYGPAEASVTSTIARIDTTAEIEPPIGLPVGVLSWVVQPSFLERLVSIGEIGELCLEGPLVGLGYYKDVSKTSEVFNQSPRWLSHPPSGHGGRTGGLYMTGDLVRYNNDGSLTFVGRKDELIKINGQRVELGDIQHHVKTCLENKADYDLAVVVEVVQSPLTCNPVLVAFVCNQTKECSKDLVDGLTNGIQHKLAQVIPAWMFPMAYIPLASIPVTGTGKTDRRRLRQIGASFLERLHRETSSEHHDLGTETEEQLRSTLAKVLGIDDSSRIGLQDNLMLFGLDSINAMKLTGAVREGGLMLSVADVFNNPSLSDLAKVVRRAEGKIESIPPFSLLKSGARVESGIPVTNGGIQERAIAVDTIGDPSDMEGLDPAAGIQLIQREAGRLCSVNEWQVEDVFPCTPLQSGLLAMTVKRKGDYVARVALHLQENVDIDRFRRAWEDTMAQTPILRTSIVNIPIHGMVQVVLAKDIEWHEAEDLKTYLQEDREQAMGLGTPLTRVALIHQQQGNTTFVLTIHHAIYDGWCMPIFLRALTGAYQGRTPQRSQSFQAFVSQILSIDENTMRNYWKAQFSGSEAIQFPCLPSPMYAPRSDSSFEHVIEDLSWPNSVVTASNAIRTAWAVLSAHYTNSSDSTFGIVSSGRQAAVPGIENMAGPTIATGRLSHASTQLRWSQNSRTHADQYSLRQYLYG